MTNQPGSVNRSFALSRPGWIGRVLRFAVGALQLNFILSAVPHARWFILGPISDNIFYWLAVGVAFWLLPVVIDIGFKRAWGRRSQLVVLIVALVAGMVDALLFGQLWTPLLSALVFGLAVYVHTHLGLSHILSAFLATPGCEMRAVPHLVTLIQGGDPQTQVCPGMWDRLDRWEAGTPT